jgi:hypothetical protein
MTGWQKSDPKLRMKPGKLWMNTSKPCSEITLHQLLDGVVMQKGQMGRSFGKIQHQRSARLSGSMRITLWVAAILLAAFCSEMDIPQKEQGFLKSNLDVAKVFLRHSKGSATDYGHPRGLFSLIAAGVRPQITVSENISKP